MFLVYLLAFFVGALPFSRLYKLFQKRTTAHKVSHIISENIKLHFMLDSWIGIIIYLLNFLKIFLFLKITSALFFPETIPIIISAAALILGDCYSPFDKKNKSKGVFASISAYTSLFPISLLFLGICYVVCLIYFPYRFISFIIISALMPFILFITGNSAENILLSLIIFIITTIRLIPNIQRYLEQKEPTIQKEFFSRHK